MLFILNTACLRPKLTAAKIMDVIAGLPHCVGQAADAVPAYTPGKNGRCSQIIENFQIGMSRYLDTSSTTQMAKIMETIEDPWYLLNEICTVFHELACSGKDNAKKLF